jgi:hypothetical protein
MKPPENDEAVRWKDFSVKNSELQVRYLTDRFGHMWTWFNYFVGIDSALVGGKLILGNYLQRWRSSAWSCTHLVRHGCRSRLLVRIYRSTSRTPPICSPRKCGMLLPMGGRKGSPISKAPVKRHSTTSTRHSVNGAVCGMTPSPFSLHARVTESHPSCLRQSCRLHPEPRSDLGSGMTIDFSTMCWR